MLDDFIPEQLLTDVRLSEMPGLQNKGKNIFSIKQNIFYLFLKHILFNKRVRTMETYC